MSLLLIDSQNTQHWHLDEQGIHKITALVAPNKAYLIDESCHILKASLPVKQVRQIKKALPFALEEQLACEIEEAHLHYVGKQGGDAYAAAVQHSVMERIKLDFPDLTELQFLPLCLPLEKNAITVCLMDNRALIRFSQFNAASVPASLLAMSLEQSSEVKNGLNTIHLYQDEGDYELLRSQLESLELIIVDQNINGLLAKIETDKDNNLLSGPYFVAPKKASGKPNKTRLAIGLAASLFVCSLTINWIQASQFSHMAKETQQASKRFYKSLFPNERIVGIKRQFRDKLESAGAGGNGASGGFSDLLAQTGAIIKSDENLDLHNIRYSQKKGQLELEIRASSIAQLDALKQTLEGKQLKVEIASASNTSAKKVKGVLKVSANG